MIDNKLCICGRQIKLSSERCRYCALRYKYLKEHEKNRGVKFGTLTVIDFVSSEKERGIWYACICDCGTKCVIKAHQITKGHIKKCGNCGKRDFEQNTYKTRHGMSKTSTYRIWDNMIRRCHSTKDKSYGRYGGKGIYVCQRWRDLFDNFLSDMGERPPGLQIDRIDSKGPYSPENCRWVTLHENLKNRSFGK